MIRFSVKAAQGEAPVTLNVSYPDDLDSLVEKFGAQEVYNAARQSHVINMQSIARRLLLADGTASAIEQHLSSWTPGVRAARGAKKISLDEVSELVKAKLRAKGFSESEISTIIEGLA